MGDVSTRLLRRLRRCPMEGARLSPRRIAVTFTMPVALLRLFVRWRPPRRRRRRHVER